MMCLRWMVLTVVFLVNSLLDIIFYLLQPRSLFHSFISHLGCSALGWVLNSDAEAIENDSGINLNCTCDCRRDDMMLQCPIGADSRHVRHATAQYHTRPLDSSTAHTVASDSSKHANLISNSWDSLPPTTWTVEGLMIFLSIRRWWLYRP